MKFKYDYLFVDGQYLLTRNFHALKNSEKFGVAVRLVDGSVYLDEDGNKVMVDFPSFTSADLKRSLFFTIAKILRNFPSRKVVLLWDKSPYYRSQIVRNYKGGRVYYSESDLETIEQDKDPIGYAEMLSNVQATQIKTHAKFEILRDFPKFGLICFISQGYEADDLARIASINFNGSNKKIGLLSADSDWKYLLNPNCDWITPHGVVTTYDDLMSEIPSGIDPYVFHTYLDSFSGGHNNLKPTISELGKKQTMPALIEALADETHEEWFEDADLARAQVSTFAIEDWKGFRELSRCLGEDALVKNGSYVNPSYFEKECDLGIKKSKYLQFLSTIDVKQYVMTN